jgi:hypothetical protein
MTMAKRDQDKIMLAEHVLEVRHDASGTLLDVRGFLADYIRKEKFLPHWNIRSNVVNFRDNKDEIKLEGAFVGYKSAGYVVLNPQTRNFFPDRATAFWKLLLRNEHYEIPKPTRFGARTKVFVPSGKSFDAINEVMFEELFTQKIRGLIGGTETDLQFTIELKEKSFDVRVIGGPIHKDEAGRYFQFTSEEFKKSGLFLDIDIYQTSGLLLPEIPRILKKAVDMTWEKTERVASGLGL